MSTTFRGAEPRIPSQGAAWPAGDGVPAGRPPGPPVNLLESLRRRLGLALAVFVLVNLLGFPAVLWKGRPKYLAEAVVYVSPRFVKTLQEDREVDVQAGEYRNFVEQQVKTINRFDIVEESLAKLGDKRAWWQKPGESNVRAARRLQAALDIHTVPDTYQVAVDLEGDKPDGLADIVNTVVDTYLVKSQQEEFYASDKRLKDLREEQQRLEQETVQKTAQRTELAKELGVTAFTEAYPNPYDRLMITVQDALTELRQNRFEANAQREALNLPNGPERAKAVRAFAHEMVVKDTGLSSLYYYINERRTRLLVETNGLGPDHPTRRAAEREIANLEAEETRFSRKLEDSYVAMLEQERGADAFKAQQAEKDMEGEVERLRTKAAWYSAKFQQGLTLGQDLDRLRKRLDAVDDRVTFLTMESQAPGFVRWFSRAMPPDLPEKGGRRKYMALLFLASLVLGVVAAVAADVTDPRVERAGDAEGVLGFPILGWLPDRRAVEAGDVRRQLQRATNRLVLDQMANQSRIFAFTGVKAGVGTTTAVMELAATLTQHGAAALAVEANAQHPDARYGGGASGLVAALRGQQRLEAVIVPGAGETPDRVAAGIAGAGDSLPEVYRLVELLHSGTGQYRAVLLDLPPIAASSDAEYVAALADVVVLVAEAGRVTKAELRAAARALERLRPRAVAVLLNRAAPDGAGRG
ncbi:MAG TPA: hypothetical protein VFA33_28975 [Bryobacteraceae bacterium]|nr:hypothetical protein [Bryobacteraceae bacterium]